MNFKCPSCNKSGTIDESTVPDSGMYANCPDCKTRFLIKKEVPKDFTFEPILNTAKPEPIKESITSIPPTAKQQKPSSGLPLKGNPWRRYWARTLDTLLLVLPVGYLFGLFFPNVVASIVERSGGSVEATYPLGMIILPFAMLTEAIILSATGTTFGKWLLNISVVRKQDGDKLTFSEAFMRSVLVWVKGLGFGLPLVGLFTMGFAAEKIKKNVTASWDDSVSANVNCSPLSAWRVFLTVISFLILFVVHGVLGEMGKSAPTVNRTSNSASQISDQQPSPVSPSNSVANDTVTNNNNLPYTFMNRYYIDQKYDEYIDLDSIKKTGQGTLSFVDFRVGSYYMDEVNCYNDTIRTIHRWQQLDNNNYRVDGSVNDPITNWQSKSGGKSGLYDYVCKNFN